MPLAELASLYDMRIENVVHVGCHLAEEADAYDAVGVGEVFWIEADPETAEKARQILADRPHHHVIEACVTDVDGGEATFHRTNNRQSSSVLSFGTHAIVSPTVKVVETFTVGTRTLDSLVMEHNVQASFVNLDLQGAELLALTGGELLLGGVDWVYCEANIDTLYIGCALLHELDESLEDRGFDRVAIVMAGKAGWGDALYGRREVIP